MIAVAVGLLVIGGACFVGRAVVGPSLADRIVAVDGLVTTIVAGILIHSADAGTDRYLDVALVVAFIGFVGTAAGARFVERRGG